MRTLTELWISLARIRRRIRKPTREAWEAERAGWIDAHAPGRSFVDVGGQLFLLGGRAFAAEAAGATDVTLVDAGDPFPEFLALREARGSRIRYVQGDAHDPVTIERIGTHDLVWCTGVLYHSPDPLSLLNQLREITGEYLFLGSHTIPEVPGVRQACVFYPFLDEGSRAAYSRPHWDGARDAWGIGTPFVDTPMLGHGNFWWGLTPSALCAMVRAARFEIVSVSRERNHSYPWYTDIVARPVPRDPSVPPVSYYRERGEARQAGEEIPPLEGYYDWARRRAGETP